ncbi:hypothetical protein [uncultured Bradyrhizobium sp.]|uniref:hypothetical protein n=1 Tax=uncultured Bradyrhizobium sp. TaxID=199684 RepID=UPI00262E454F|nr:hypothetical protein [uncultured Bradyrhizobium sp.]
MLELKITDGVAEPIKDLELFPSGILECKLKAEHSVIIGNFLPPTPAGGLSELSRRIARSLEFALRTRLQSAHLTLNKQPSFVPCEAAKPPTTRFGSGYAKALDADAFVDGDISRDRRLPGYAVNFYVSDAYGLFSDPQLARNRSLNLETPSEVEVSDETHVAVLASIAAGLARKDDCVTAIKVITVAERFLEQPGDNPIPAGFEYLAGLRKSCEVRLPNVNLRKNTQ